MLLCHSIFFVRNLALAGEKIELEQTEELNVERDLNTRRVTSFRSAIFTGSLDGVKRLLENESPQGRISFLNHSFRYGFNNYASPLIFAVLFCETDETDIVKYLIKVKAGLGLTDSDGPTPLHYAAKEGNLEIVKVLVEAKSDLNESSDLGHSALHAAIEKEAISVIQVLLSAKAEVDLKDSDGVTALQLAVDKNRADIVQTLVDAHSNLETREEHLCSDGMTALHAAIRLGRADIVVNLIQAKADVKRKTNSGVRTLEMAKNLEDGCSTKQEVIGLLLRAKCDPY